MNRVVVLRTNGLGSELLVSDLLVKDGVVSGIVRNGAWNLRIKNGIVQAKAGREIVNSWIYSKLSVVEVPVEDYDPEIWRANYEGYEEPICRALRRGGWKELV